MKEKFFPLKRGYNYCLGWYQPDESLGGYKKSKKRPHHTVQKPVREESHMPSIVQASVDFDMF